MMKIKILKLRGEMELFIGMLNTCMATAINNKEIG